LLSLKKQDENMAEKKSRIRKINDKGQVTGEYVLYWMQASQRAEYNYALDFAIAKANKSNLPLLVAFGLSDAYPEANLRHYRFMLEGLQDTANTLDSKSIKFVLQLGHPPEVAIRLSRQAAVVVCDRGYLRHQKSWRKEVSEQAHCAVYEVESDVVVPVSAVSNKAEYAARTIRPRIMRQLGLFMNLYHHAPVIHDSRELDLAGEDLQDIESILTKLDLDRSVPSVSRFFKGGTSEARRRLKQFIDEKLDYYEENRNQPQTDYTSVMSPYLHFGQISPLYLALEIDKAETGSKDDRNSYLEELVVRRELAINFVNYTDDYDSFSNLPEWARITLGEHESDAREFIYTFEQLEQAKTHDIYWNAAMLEMVHTGYMHNYMRMYWGKKVLEWTESPQEAYDTLLKLNNKYFLDGRDPNSYAGVAWIFGKHDRAWFERSIFGKVRYMAASGLERKCDIKGYVEKINKLIS
jgi:deoxyribodipyrimidine photo-lyase